MFGNSALLWFACFWNFFNDFLESCCPSLQVLAKIRPELDKSGIDAHGVDVTGTVEPVVVPGEAGRELRVGPDAGEDAVEGLGERDGGCSLFLVAARGRAAEGLEALFVELLLDGREVALEELVALAAGVVSLFCFFVVGGGDVSGGGGGFFFFLVCVGEATTER